MPRPAPKSPITSGYYSKSTPNLPTLRTLDTKSAQQSRSSQTKEQPKTAPAYPTVEDAASPSTLTCPSEGAASIEELSLDATIDPASSAASGTEDETDDDTLPDNLPTTAEPLYRQTSRSNSYLGPPTFAPPFYNRPPTPLPPSPSLTSLLRPNFSSAAPSRPGTPDPSSDEGGTTTTTATTITLPTGAQTPNSAAATTLSSSFRTAKPIPRASPKVPTYEYYGFTLYLTSSLAFLIYLLWSFLPSPFLHQLGIYYYPNRWWSLAIPAWLVMLVVWVFVALASYNTGTLTLGMKELGCLVDEAANIAVVNAEGKIVTDSLGSSWAAAGVVREDKGRKGQGGVRKKRASDGPVKLVDETRELDWRTLWNEGTDAVLDVPIGGVCEVLYGRPDGDEDDEGLKYQIR